MSRYRSSAVLRCAALTILVGLWFAAATALAAESVDKARQYIEEGDNRAAEIELLFACTACIVGSPPVGREAHVATTVPNPQ
jgi:hypothetical protein